MEFSWGDIFKIAVTAGLVNVLLNQGVNWYREHSSKKALAAYTAMRIAVVLESFAKACASFIQENNNAQTFPDQEFPDWNISLPPLGNYPDDPEGWRALDRGLAGRALELKNNLHISQDIISGTIEYVIEDLESELTKNAASRGLEAWNLAVELRRKHSVGPAQPILTYAETLEKSLEKLDQI